MVATRGSSERRNEIVRMQEFLPHREEDHGLGFGSVRRELKERTTFRVESAGDPARPSDREDEIADEEGTKGVNRPRTAMLENVEADVPLRRDVAVIDLGEEFETRRAERIVASKLDGDLEEATFVDAALDRHVVS